jgi:hypothetical protein
MTETQPDPKQHRKLSPEQHQALHDATREQLAMFECHKIVQAARIKEVQYGYDETRDRNVTLLVPEDPRLLPIEVSKEYVAKHDPKAPGYFVRYEDGYESWSPVGTFEQGYALLEEAKPQDLKAILLAADPEAATAPAANEAPQT